MKTNKNKIKMQEDVLALELAVGLGDTKSLQYYQSVTKKHEEKILREIFNKVRAMPDGKIKKTRGALFNYLLQLKTQKTPTTNENQNNNCD